MKKQKVEKRSTDHALLNMVTPIGITFKRTKFMIGECYSRIYAVTKYPPTTTMGWFASVANLPSTIISQTFIPIDNGALIESLSNSIMQSRSTANSTSVPRDQQRAEQGIEDGQRLLRQIDLLGEAVGYMVNLIMPIAKDDKELEKLSDSIQSKVAAISCRVRILNDKQKEGFKTLSPHHICDDEIIRIAKKIIPSSTFVGGLSFSRTGYSDGVGSWMANDTAGGLVLLDIWKKGADRTNSNFVILGASGRGKSTALKNIIISEFIRGTKIFIIDPEREFRDMVENLGGDWINCGGNRRQYNAKNRDKNSQEKKELTSDGMINPLHLTENTNDEEDEDFGIGDLAKHMKKLEVFFALALQGISDIQLALIKETLIELYEKFDIDWNTNSHTLTADDFPIISDLYLLLQDKEKRKKHQKDYETLVALLMDIAVGSDSFIWNGKTTIKANSQIVCLDTHEIQESSDRVKKAQYFNVLNWAWEQMSKDRNEHVLLIADEAYLMIDPKIPQSLVFLCNVAKRARKYQAGIVIVSHSVTDFLHESIKNYAQPLLDMPSYKLMFGCEGKDLQELSELYNFTESEKEMVGTYQQKHALFQIGNKRIPVKIKVPDYRLDIIGTGGGV